MRAVASARASFYICLLRVSSLCWERRVAHSIGTTVERIRRIENTIFVLHVGRPQACPNSTSTITVIILPNKIEISRRRFAPNQASSAERQKRRSKDLKKRSHTAPRYTRPRESRHGPTTTTTNKSLCCRIACVHCDSHWGDSIQICC